MVSNHEAKAATSIGVRNVVMITNEEFDVRGPYKVIEVTVNSLDLTLNEPETFSIVRGNDNKKVDFTVTLLSDLSSNSEIDNFATATGYSSSQFAAPVARDNFVGNNLQF